MKSIRGIFNKVINRARLYYTMFRYASAHNKDFVKKRFNVFQDLLYNLNKFGIDSLQNKRVLDVGCGKSLWLSLLLNHHGAKVTAIDTISLQTVSGFSKYLRIIRRNGIDRAVRILFWDLFFSKSFYRELRKVSGYELVYDGIKIKEGNVMNLPFRDYSFDVVVSYEVLEHVPDVDRAVSELNRVLTPHGISYHYVHNYTSISGGHHTSWQYPDKKPSSRIPPWDHLRLNQFPEIPSWLNRFRMHVYRESFKKYFDILQWTYAKKEGEQLLSDAIRKELKDYSDLELLPRGFVIIGSPKKLG